MLSLLFPLFLAAPLPTQCTTTWIKTPTDAKLSRTCVMAILKLGYADPTGEMLDFDPDVKAKIQLPPETLTQLRAAVTAAGEAPYKGLHDMASSRVEEILGTIERNNPKNQSLEKLGPLVNQALAGKPIAEPDLLGAGLGKVQLRILRNASYARHGYKFKSPELTEFFYGGTPPRVAIPEAKRTKNVKLSLDDQKNVKLVKDTEKLLP